jgi:hypothetical protein
VETFHVTNIAGPWTSEAWEKQLESLTQHVKRCFAEAAPRFAPPNDDGCRHFANALLAYFLPSKKGPLTSEKKAIKYGRTFLKHLAQSRESIKLGLRVAIARNYDEKRKEFESTLFHMKEVERHSEYLFDRLSPQRSSKNQSIRWLSNFAQHLWREANGGRAPRSKNADDPIVQLIVLVLTAIHREPIPATIAEALRGRR